MAAQIEGSKANAVDVQLLAGMTRRVTAEMKSMGKTMGTMGKLWEIYGKTMGNGKNMGNLWGNPWEKLESYWEIHGEIYGEIYDIYEISGKSIGIVWGNQWFSHSGNVIS